MIYLNSYEQGKVYDIMEDLNQSKATYFDLAKKCIDLEEYEVALNYYREILKLDIQDSAAKRGEEYMRSELRQKVYFQTAATWRLLEGRLELHWGELVFWPIRNQRICYDFRMVKDLSVQKGKIMFDYWSEHVEIACKFPKKWRDILKNALDGRYPRLPNDKYSALEIYISNHYDWEQRDQALKYFIELSGVSEACAEPIVDEILGYGMRI